MAMKMATRFGMVLTAVSSFLISDAAFGQNDDQRSQATMRRSVADTALSNRFNICEPFNGVSMESRSSRRDRIRDQQPAIMIITDENARNFELVINGCQENNGKETDLNLRLKTDATGAQPFITGSNSVTVETLKFLNPLQDNVASVRIVLAPDFYAKKQKGVFNVTSRNGAQQTMSPIFESQAVPVVMIDRATGRPFRDPSVQARRLESNTVNGIKAVLLEANAVDIYENDDNRVVRRALTLTQPQLK